MAKTEKRPYSLPRDANETKRLGIQADIYDQNIGFLVHPQIAKSIPSNAEIADVACGSGAWVLKVASSTAYQCHGLDMSPAQFPQTFPGNCKFGTLDLLDDVPEEMQNRLDLVHMRLLVVGLTGDDWQRAADNALKLLRPGGWLQWCESNFEDMDALRSESDASTQALRSLLQRMIQHGRQHGKFCGDIGRLFNTIQSAGFQNCSEDIVSSDRIPSTRAAATLVEHQAMAMVCKTMLDQENAGDKLREEVDQLIKHCEAEISGGKAYWRWNVHTIVGQKASS